MGVSEKLSVPGRPDGPPSNLSLDPEVRASINVLVVDDEQLFYARLRSKLHWGAPPAS